MSKKVAVAGSTGFVGYNTAKHLLELGFTVNAIVRKSSNSPRIARLAKLGANLFEVDYDDLTTLADSMNGCDVVYHFVGASAQSYTSNIYDVNTRITQRLVRVAKRVGVGGFIYNSGLGVNTHTTQSYFLSKLLAEKAIRESGLKYVIFRPSYIIGVDDEFSTYLLENILHGRPIPIYGSGNYRVQPILIDDAVKVYAACLERPQAWSKTFDLVGRDAIRFLDYVRLLAATLGRNVRLLRVDLEHALRDAMRQKAKRRVNPYLSVDELEVLISDFVSSSSRLEQVFSIKLTTLNEALKAIAKKITQS